MRNQNSYRLSFVTGLALAFAGLLLPHTTQAMNISKTAKAGAYSVTLKVLPAESFSGPKAEMARDGGAEANLLDGPEHPNHHMVAFVSKDGKPVESATVKISYRELNTKGGAWTKLPVVRMHVTGKGLGTTHYGNNVKLDDGNYEARVTVNGKSTATFRFSLEG
jgi:hypothetical protein